MALSKKPVNGMKDILPEEMQIRDYVQQVIKDHTIIYRKYDPVVKKSLQKLCPQTDCP